MRGVNKVIIIGNLGNDPEHRQFDGGGSVTNISVATSEQWTDKNSGEKREATEWHRVSLFNRLAEVAAQYLRKGSKVYIEGSLKTRKYQAQDGSDRYVTEIRASQMQMLDSAGDNQGGNNQYNQAPQQGQTFNQDTQPQNFNQAPPQTNRSVPQGVQTSRSVTPTTVNNSGPVDDDIPFAPFYAGE